MTESDAFNAAPGLLTTETKMPDAFVVQVRDLLTHLHDLAYIQELAIVSERAAALQRPLRTIASTIKQEVIECFEELNPGREFYFRSPEARVYNILLLHYVERFTVQKAADELGVSERQAYRDLRQAETDLARLLWRKNHESVQTSAVRESLAPHVQTDAQEMVNLHDLLASAVEVVRSLAATASIPITLAPTDHPITLMINLPVARQVLITMLSRAIQNTADHVIISVADEDAQVRVDLQYTLRQAISNQREHSDVVLQSMVERLGWRVSENIAGVTLTLPRATPKKVILCIDDDVGFSELLRRYLTGLPVVVFSATNGQQGIEQMLQISPDLVILDVMMAGLDGWATLQRIRTHTSTQHTPVMICSVFDDPELAYSLGANAMLAKPVAPAIFLHTLEEMKVI